MLDTDLTSVSTQGWFTEKTIENELLPVSTFGWWYVVVDEDEEDIYYNIISFDLPIIRLIHLDLER